jgi:hypothetical protein
MNREGTALGVDSLFRLIGTGEDNHRRGQIRDEHPGDANHKICLWCHGQDFETREVWAILQDPFSLRHRALGYCRCLAAHDGGPVRRRVPIHRRKTSKRSYVRKGAVTLRESPRTIS